MKIAVLSDFHFGYEYNSELEEDSFNAAEEAVEKALDADVILIAGDIFDTRVPKTSEWAKAIRILVKPMMRDSTVNFVSCSKEMKEISKRNLKHLPVIAIHGTHERRSRGEVNALEALEHAGILIYLHCDTIVFEKDGVKVAIHGMSGVPESYAKDVLYKWNPQPLPNCINILMMHQSIEPYIYSPLSPPSLSLSNLPKGFDLIVDGHLHITGQEKIDNTLLLIPGSTIVTQQEANEADTQKGFYFVDADKEVKATFVPLENNRKFFYREIKLEGSLRDQVENVLKEILNKNFAKPPLIKLKIFGKEMEVVEQELREIERRYADKAVITFTKELESPEITRKIEFLRNLREQKMSVEEIGINLLRKNLDELKFNSSFDYGQAFRLLTEGKVENAFNVFTGEQKTLVMK